MAAKEKKNVYQIVTDRIVDQLKNGTVPWHQPWQSRDYRYPTNAITKKAYHGVNVFLLLSNGYGSNLYATFKQYQSVGATVKKGEKGYPVVYWKFSYFCEDCGFLKEVTGKECECGSKIKTVPLLRYYTVFNIDQVDDLPDKYKPAKKKLNNNNPIKKAQSIIKGYKDKPEIKHGGNRACYSPAQDQITVPEMGDFDNSEEYYSVVFHEVIHSTGHEKRLNRDIRNFFGDEKYTKEELVAEMGSAFLAAESHIINKTLDNSAAYINSWIVKLESNPKWVVFAASQAEKATKYVLN